MGKKLEVIIRKSIDVSSIAKDIRAAGFTPKKEKALPFDFLFQLGNIKHFEKRKNGWVRWKLINRDFGPSSEKEMNWKEGEQYCANRGARLGTRIEHFLLFTAMLLNPKIKKQFFPDTKESWYRTEETYAGSPGSAWVVFFGYGDVTCCSKDYNDFVRPVRVSQ